MILYLCNLTPCLQEEKEFVSFLQSSQRSDSQEVLLMYYLQRSRFSEALQLQQRLKSLGVGQGSGARDAIMSRYSDILPGDHRIYSVIHHSYHYPTSGVASTLASKRVTLAPVPQQINRPVPLSVTLQDR